MYEFRREDNGKSVMLGFNEMMAQDVAGYVTLPDGVRARRAHDGKPIGKQAEYREMAGAPLLPSDALGFTSHQLAEFEMDRKQHGFSGVEFVRDKTCHTQWQVKCSSRREWEKYVAHRQMVDKNKSSGAALSAEQLRKAQEKVSEQYGTLSL